MFGIAVEPSGSFLYSTSLHLVLFFLIRVDSCDPWSRIPDPICRSEDSGEASVAAIGAEANEAEAGLPAGYWQACRLAQQRQYDEARRLYAELESAAAE